MEAHRRNAEIAARDLRRLITSIKRNLSPRAGGAVQCSASLRDIDRAARLAGRIEAHLPKRYNYGHKALRGVEEKFRRVCVVRDYKV
jgi:hypothetical protein